MSGTWINCEGSNYPPAVKAPDMPRWARTDKDKQLVRDSYGACSVCGKAVKLRSDGTVRVHVNSPEAKNIRTTEAQRVREHAVSDLLKMRAELSDPP